MRNSTQTLRSQGILGTVWCSRIHAWFRAHIDQTSQRRKSIVNIDWIKNKKHLFPKDCFCHFRHSYHTDATKRPRDVTIDRQALLMIDSGRCIGGTLMLQLQCLITTSHTLVPKMKPPAQNGSTNIWDVRKCHVVHLYIQSVAITNKCNTLSNTMFTST